MVDPFPRPYQSAEDALDELQRLRLDADKESDPEGHGSYGFLVPDDPESQEYRKRGGHRCSSWSNGLEHDGSGM